MEHFVGIDVAKDRLDVHIRPGGEALAVARDDKGLAILVARLRALAPALVAVEATGGYQTVVASALGAAQLPLAMVNPRRSANFACATGKLAKTDRMLRQSLTLPRQCARRHGRSPTPRRRPCANWWRGAGRSSR